MFSQLIDLWCASKTDVELVYLPTGVSVAFRAQLSVDPAYLVEVSRFQLGSHRLEKPIKITSATYTQMKNRAMHEMRRHREV